MIQAPHLVAALLLAFALAACSGTLVTTEQPDAGDAPEDASQDRSDSGKTPGVDADPGQDAAPPEDAANPQDAAEPDATLQPDAAEPDAAEPDAAAPDAEPDVPETLCALGEPCEPIVIDRLPYADTRDTRQAPSSVWDQYSCAPGINEGGGEFVYQLDLTERGRLSVAVDDTTGDNRDIDVHLLEALDPDACLARDNAAFNATLEPGRYYIVADTWVNGSGVAFAGVYNLTVTFTPLAAGACAVVPQDLKMVWASCDPSLDCYEATDPSTGQLARYLRTPATGPVVKEAHLVTTGEDFDNTWPSASREQIERHYTLSQQVSGYAMSRTEAWAPAGEGGSRYGQGSTGSKIPADAEAWYVNMYWRNKPAPGTRMIITNPANGRAVVAAAGYETGPGANTAVGGVAEEIHHYLGTTHRSTLTLGFAEDQTLPFGPITCE